METEISACALFNDNSVTEMEVSTQKRETTHLNDS